MGNQNRGGPAFEAAEAEVQQRNTIRKMVMGEKQWEIRHSRYSNAEVAVSEYL